MTFFASLPAFVMPMPYGYGPPSLMRACAVGLALLVLASTLGGCAARAPRWARTGVAHAPPTLRLLPDSARGSGPDAGRTAEPAVWRHWPDGFAAVYATLARNLHPPNRFQPTRYARPAPAFRGVYLWDTAFIAQVWRPWDAATAAEVSKAVLRGAADDGRLQHFTSRLASSDLTQPPVMAWSAWATYRWSGDRTFLADAYPRLVAYRRWLYQHRRLPGGLFFWAAPYESGMDNSPRFGSRDEADVIDTRHVAAVDLSAYVALQGEVLAAMARTLGRPDEAEAFAAETRRLRARINDRLWDDEVGLYFDRDTTTGAFVRAKTVASLVPLFAGVPDAARAERLRAHILDPAAFNARIPVPSVALDDPAFEKDMWRGPTWVNTSYMIVEGLRRYGFGAAAARLSFKVVEGVYRTHAETGRVVEFYDPERYDLRELHRKRGHWWKRLTLGDEPVDAFVGWTGLANTLLIETLCGLRYVDGALVLQPRFPPEAQGLAFALTLPSRDLRLSLRVTGDGRAVGTVAVGSAPARRFDLAPGAHLVVHARDTDS